MRFLRFFNSSNEIMLKNSFLKMFKPNFMIYSIEGNLKCSVCFFFSSFTHIQTQTSTGNIGSGKSTILSILSSRNDTVESLPEPVSEWSNMRTGEDLLKNFYEGNPGWTFPFENLVQLSRVKSFYEAHNRFESSLSSTSSNKKNVFIERSILSSYNVFILNSYEQNRLTKVEFDILTQYYALFKDRMKKLFFKVNIFHDSLFLSV